MKRTRARKGASKGVVLVCAKAALAGCIVTAVLVLLLAMTMRWEWIRMERVELVNTLIKAVSAAYCGVLTAGLSVRRGWLVSGGVGVAYMVIAFAVFGILNGGFAFGLNTVSDLLMAFACAACVSIAVKLLRESGARKAD